MKWGKAIPMGPNLVAQAGTGAQAYFNVAKAASSNMITPFVGISEAGYYIYKGNTNKAGVAILATAASMALGLGCAGGGPLLVAACSVGANQLVRAKLAETPEDKK